MNRPIEADRLALELGALALERKIDEVTILDLRSMNTFTDFMIILSGKSTRQVQALAEHILRGARTNLHLKPLGSEGVGQGNWVLLDYDSVIIHIFLDDMRGYYDLEGLWSEAPHHRWFDPDLPPKLD